MGKELRKLINFKKLDVLRNSSEINPNINVEIQMGMALYPPAMFTKLGEMMAIN